MRVLRWIAYGIIALVVGSIASYALLGSLMLVLPGSLAAIGLLAWILSWPLLIAAAFVWLEGRHHPPEWRRRFGIGRER